jgi:hypothetical protein
MDDQQLIAYLGDSPSFCFDAGISLVSDSCFRRNVQLQSVVFGANSRLQSLPASAFECCAHLRSITVPKRVLVIGKDCFYKCGLLETVTFKFPARIRRIDSRAFYKCSSLTPSLFRLQFRGEVEAEENWGTGFRIFPDSVIHNSSITK